MLLHAACSTVETPLSMSRRHFPGSLPVSIDDRVALVETRHRIVSAALRALAPLLAAAGLAVGLPARRREEPAPEIRPVRAMTIEKRASRRHGGATGTVQAQTEINQSFRIDGRLIERTVDVGDTVKPGQLIARLDPQNEESGAAVGARAAGRGAGAAGRGAQQLRAHARTGGRGRGVARAVRSGRGAAARRPRRRSRRCSRRSTWRRTG